MAEKYTFKLQEGAALLAAKIPCSSSVYILYQSAASPPHLFEHVCNRTRNRGKTNECGEHNESFLAIKQNFQHPSLVIYRVA